MSDSLFSFRNWKSSKFDLGLVEQVKQFKDEHQQQPYTLLYLTGRPSRRSFCVFPKKITVKGRNMKNVS